MSWPEPKSYPGVVQCRGGWFAVESPGDLGSGPWKSQASAELAMKGKFKEANLLDKTG